MSEGASQPGGDKEALQAGPVVENCSGTERFRVSASRAQGTAIRIAAFGERRRKHVPLGVVSATAAFGVEGAPIPSRAPPFVLQRCALAAAGSERSKPG